jgi:hypothetical protein
MSKLINLFVSQALMNGQLLSNTLKKTVPKVNQHDQNQNDAIKPRLDIHLSIFLIYLIPSLK